MIRRMVRSLLFLAFLAIPGVAVASPITFLFTGSVTGVDPALSGTFDTTQTLSGSYTFDSTSAFGCPTFNNSGCIVPLTALDFTIGAYTVTKGTGGLILVNNNTPVFFGSPRDRYRVLAGDVSGPLVDGKRPNDFEFTLSDFTQTVFSSDALPLIPPDLSAFQSTPWELSFGGGFLTPADDVFGEITSLTLSPEGNPVNPIPEPGTLLLLGSGLLSVAGYGKRELFRKG